MFILSKHNFNFEKKEKNVRGWLEKVKDQLFNRLISNDLELLFDLVIKLHFPPETSMCLRPLYWKTLHDITKGGSYTHSRST